MAFAYSVRFSRCTGTRPGFGAAAAAASSAASSADGRRGVGGLVRPRPPGGGISRVRSLRATFSHTSAVVADVLDVHLVEQQPGRFQPCVVAGDAIFVEHTPRCEPPPRAPAPPGFRRPTPTQTNTTGWP